MLVSSLLVAIQRARGHVATVITPITQIITAIVGFLYVDDTSLYPKQAYKDKCGREAQDLTDDSGWHLIDTGGGCKAIKSSGHLLNYGFDDCGQLHCESLIDDYALYVPTIVGPEKIELLPAHEGKETLGVITAPDGNLRVTLL